MDKEYGNTYNELFEYYPDFYIFKDSFPSEIDFIYEIRRAINIQGGYLRADAKYFLLINFHHMVVRPILRTPIRNIDQTQLSNYINNDISFIIRTLQNSRTEPSGHEVIRVIDENWRNLNFSKINVWG